MYKPILVFIFCLIIVSSFVSSADWDNVKSYDNNTQTITITNILGLGSDIAKIRLLSPLEHNYIEVGSNRVVLQFEIEYLSDDAYTNALKELEVLNMRTGKEIAKTFSWAEGIKENVVVNDYETVCEKVTENVTQTKEVCTEKVIGTHTEERLTSWAGLGKDINSKGKKIIGLVTDVNIGDYYDGIPTFFGVKIDEWASWEAIVVDSALGLTSVSWASTNGAGDDMKNGMYIRITDGVTRLVSALAGANTGTLGCYALNMENGTVVQGTYDDTADNCTFNSDKTVYPNGTNVYVYVYSAGAYNYAYSGYPAHFGTTGTNIRVWGSHSSGDGNQTEEVDGRVVAFDKFYTQVQSPDTAPVVSQFSPANNTKQESHNLLFNCTATDDEGVLNVTLYIDNVLNKTFENETDFETTVSFQETYGFAEGLYSYICKARDTANQEGLNATYNFTIDSIYPTVNMNSPVNATVYYIEGGSTNITINATVSDNVKLDTCWVYNTTDNNTIACNTAVGNASLLPGTHSVYFYANDTLNHLTTNKSTITINKYSNRLNFTEPAPEGVSTIFRFNVSATDLTSVSANITYNNTIYIMTKDWYNTTDAIFSRTLTTPYVTKNSSIDVNVTYLINGQLLYTTTTNQTVMNLTFNNCTDQVENIFNVTLYDELTQSLIDGKGDAGGQNATIEATITLYNGAKTIEITNYSNKFYQTNNASICLSADIGASSFILDGQLRYYGIDYQYEFYNIRDFNVTSSVIPNAIKLYDIDTTNGQSFKITYKDESLLPVADALIQVQRKYVSEGLYKIVELPKTDSNGETTASLDLGNVLYTFVIIKDGVILATFSDVIPICQNPTLENCEINFNSFSSYVEPENYNNINDFSYTFDYNATARNLTAIYSVPSGASATVLLNGTLLDRLGTTQVCTSTVTGASGTLYCNVPNSFGNGTAIIKLYKANTLVATGTLNVGANPSEIYGTNLVFLGLFLFLTLIGVGIGSNPIITGFFILIGVVIAIALNIIDATGYIGAGATVLWLVVAIILILIKGSNRT